ncbi:MAG: hypothetical protein ABGX20_18780 [Bacillus sp. (in: firmicutes)]
MFKNLLGDIIKTTIKTTFDPPVHTTVERPEKIFEKPSKTDDFLRSFFDESTYTKTPPALGSLVYCVLGPVEHSGIYIGNNQIVQLNGKGQIECVKPRTFTDHITTYDPDIFIPCKINSKDPVGNVMASGRAIDMINSKRNYNILMDNCHQFSAGCITGDFENPNNFLGWLKESYESSVDETISWVRWRWY